MVHACEGKWHSLIRDGEVFWLMGVVRILGDHAAERVVESFLIVLGVVGGVVNDGEWIGC